MSNINSETPAITEEKTVNNKNSGLGIASLVLSLIGCTLVVGAILAVIDLFTNDGRKKVCSTIAMCLYGLWLFIYIVGAMYLIKYSDEVKNVLQIRQEFEKKVSEGSVEETADEDDTPEEYQSVMENAVYYYDAMHMSKVGIYEQLTGGQDQFTEEEARYALDHLEADWNANALAAAQNYCDVVHMSEAGIYDQLTREYPYGDQFTEEEAQYAMSHLEADWNAVALAAAQTYSDVMHQSKAWISNWLVSDYPNGDRFTEEQARYAMDHLEADWNENALAKAQEYWDNWNMSFYEIYEKLTMEVWEYGGDGFTEEEARYAISNLKLK